jgi:hypothetical protein
MKKFPTFLIYISFSALLIISCKKAVNEPGGPENKREALSEMKTWFQENYPTISSNEFSILGKDKPVWETMVYNPSERKYFIEVKQENANSKICKYIVIDENKTTEPQLHIRLTTDNKAEIKNPLANIENGAIIDYKLLDGQWISSQHFKNGGEEKMKDIIVFKPQMKKSNDNPNVVDPQEDCGEHGGQWQCIEWYWQTYVNGELVYEEYLYTTCGCYGATGGGGGTTSTCESLSQEQAQTLMNAIYDETHNDISASHGATLTNEETGIITRTNNPMWMFYKVNFFLGHYNEYTAYFTGLVYKNNNNDFWKWDNIAFSSVNRSAGILPPCFGQSFSHTISNPVISGDKKKAHAVITSFTVTYTLTCAFGVETETKTTTGLEADFNAAD